MKVLLIKICKIQPPDLLFVAVFISLYISRYHSKSIPLKNKLPKKDSILKQEFHTNYKRYINLLSTLIKKSKQAYYDKYFARNWNNIKNTWKGNKFLVSLKTVASSVPIVLSLDNGDPITNS